LPGKGLFTEYFDKENEMKKGLFSLPSVLIVSLVFITGLDSAPRKRRADIEPRARTTKELVEPAAKDSKTPLVSPSIGRLLYFLPAVSSTIKVRQISL